MTPSLATAWFKKPLIPSQAWALSLNIITSFSFISSSLLESHMQIMGTSLQGGPYSAQEVHPPSRQLWLRARNKTRRQEQAASSSKRGKSIRGFPTAWVQSGKVFPIPNTSSEFPSRNSVKKMHGQLQVFRRETIKPQKSQKCVENQR